MLVPPVLVALVGLSTPASAAEVQFEGFYRGRARAFDTLSLTRTPIPETDGQPEGLAAYAQHRLWLRPKFLLSDRVGLFADIRGLDGVLWGDEVTPYATGVEGRDTFLDVPTPVFEYGLNAPTSDTDPRAPLLDITLWRLWGEVHTDIGRFTFGRVPLHWGVGIWLNDGVSVDIPFADHGDTTDRLMWEMLVQEQFYVRLAVDTPAENLLGFTDDQTAFNAAAAYRTEDLTAGLLVQLARTGAQQNAGPLNVFTVDGAADVTLGKLHGAAEVVGHFGGGDLQGGTDDASITIDDASITAIGAAVHADLDLDPWMIGLRAGLATGDGVEDLNLRTFTFDRDYSVGLFLFEQPMPVLATSFAGATDTNAGRDYSAAITGSAISNALFVKPTLRREIVDGLSAEISWLGARTARAATIDGTRSSRSYGNELQLGVRYFGIEHLDVNGLFGVFLPGSVYSVSYEDINEPSGFEDPAFGFQLSGRVHF